MFFFMSFEVLVFIGKKKYPRHHLMEARICLFMNVEVTGLEPATAWSQTRNATNCATPRFCGCKGNHLLVNNEK